MITRGKHYIHFNNRTGTKDLLKTKLARKTQRKIFVRDILFLKKNSVVLKYVHGKLIIYLTYKVHKCVI